MLLRLVAILVLSARGAAKPAAPPSVWLELTPLHDADLSDTVAHEGTITWNGVAYAARQREQPTRVSATRARGWARLLGAEEEEELTEAEYWTDVCICIGLVCFAGLAAGCTMGILSLDPLTLNLKLEGGSESEQEWAGKVLPVVSAHHHLLVSLLLCNAVANEALPIFLDRLVDEKSAIIISVTCVLIFGEILPSAVMTGPKQLQIAASLAPLVRTLMLLTWPISFPMAKLLDVVLGHGDGMTRFKRREFKALVRMQMATKALKKKAVGYTPPKRAASDSTASPAILTQEESSERRESLVKRMESPQARNPARPAAEEAAEEAGAQFSDDEVTILHSMLDLKRKTVRHLLEEDVNAFDALHMISMDAAMDYATMDRIIKWGHSRVPVYHGSRTNVRGMLLVKEHLKLDPDEATPVGRLRLRRPCVMTPSTSILEALNMFQEGRSHLALISDHGATIEECWATGEPMPPHVTILGVCTIEDVVEEMIGEEVMDETDLDSTQQLLAPCERPPPFTKALTQPLLLSTSQGRLLP